jgi:hypothetical protein
MLNLVMANFSDKRELELAALAINVNHGEF